MAVAAILAAICFSFAIAGFRSLSDMADPTAMAAARGFAWFRIFLGTVTIALALGAWRLSRHKHE